MNTTLMLCQSIDTAVIINYKYVVMAIMLSNLLDSCVAVFDTTEAKIKQ